jgi:arylsulfatase A-like enzyme
MNRRDFLKQAALGVGALALTFPRVGKSEPVVFQGLESASAEATADKKSRPNILYILCDDLGFGDVHALNPERGKIPTPHMDRLVAEGMAFTDAHSSSSVCTPTRYGIMTGRYNWRTRLQSGVLGGFSPPLIADDRLTVPKLLKQHGYATGCIGKWHLGMTMPVTKKNGKFGDQIEDGNDGTFHAQMKIADGPTTRGFDYYFGISASLDMPPFAFIENDRFTQVPTAKKKWIRTGLAAPDFEAIDVLPTLTRKACEFFAARAADAKNGKPFFLYLPLTSPHTPIVPTKEWQEKSGLNPYADFVMQTDAALGTLLAALEKNGLAENTLIIFTSDNGCSPAAKVDELEAKGHFPSWQLRGYKADIWDGGHRIPFLTRWPGKIKAGTRSTQIVCLTDLMATCAAIVGAKLPDNAGEDSVSLLPALLGTATAPLREAVVHHSISGHFAIRQDKWKLELCAGSGGWSSPKEPAARKQGLPRVQLYDMTQDISERANQQAAQPEVVARLTKLLEKYVADGRSTPGAPQKNDVSIDIWKAKPAKPE